MDLYYNIYIYIYIYIVRNQGYTLHPVCTIWLPGAHMPGAHMPGAHMPGAHMPGAHMTGAHMLSAPYFRVFLYII